jgi:hypothetical protein
MDMFPRSLPMSSLSARGQICEFECPVANGEEQRLEVGILRWSDSKKFRGPSRIDDRACNTTVAVKRYYKKMAFQAIDPPI